MPQIGNKTGGGSEVSATATSITIDGATTNLDMASDKQYRHLIQGVELPVIPCKIGDIIKFNLRRTPTGTGDTYGDDFLIEQCAMHAPFDGRGSRQRYIK